MKIAATAAKGDVDGPVDPRFGRAACFVVLDTETGTHEVHDNQQNLNAPQGAGIQAAQAVARLGVEVLLTGHVGPKAFSTLQAAGITVHSGVSGTVREAFEQCKNNKLQPTDTADVDGHW